MSIAPRPVQPTLERPVIMIRRLKDDTHFMDDTELTEPVDKSGVTGSVVGEATSCAVTHSVDIEIIFRDIDADVILRHLRFPLLVIRSRTPGIPSGPKRKTRAITL